MRTPFGLIGAILIMGIGAGAAFGDTPDVAVVQSDPLSVPTGSNFAQGTVTCPPGRSAMGGGWSVTPSNTGLPMIGSQPLPNAAGWAVSLANQSGATFALTVYALCAAVAPPGGGPAGLTGASGPQGLASAGAVGAAGVAGERGPKGARGDRGPRGLGAAVAQPLTRARCLALRKARKALPGACATRFKVRAVAR